MAKAAARVMDAVYEDGVFCPVRTVTLPNRTRVRLTVVAVDGPTAQAERAWIGRQRNAFLALAGLGASGRPDISADRQAARSGTRRTR